MIRAFPLAIIAALLVLPLSGCGGADASAPIEKSPHAPTQAQLDELTKSAMPQTGKPHHKPSARKTR
jgi:hypothetical protein